MIRVTRRAEILRRYSKIHSIIISRSTNTLLFSCLVLLFLPTRYCSYTAEYRGILGVRLLFLRQPFVKFQKAIGFGFLRQRMVLVHLLRGHFLVQMVEVMELRGVVAETVQRNLPRARFQSHDDAGETAARFQFPSVHPVPDVTPKLWVERTLDVRFFLVLQVFFLLVLGKVTERFLVAGGEDEHFVFRFSETEVVDILDTYGGFLANVLFVAFCRRGVEADDGVVAVDFRTVGVVEEGTRVTDDGASATERFCVCS